MVYTDIHLPLPGFIALDWSLMTLALIPILIRISLRQRSRGLHSLATNIADGFVILAWLSGCVLIAINTWKNSLRMKYLHSPPGMLYYGVPQPLSGHLLYVSWISLFFIYISLWSAKGAFLALYYSLFSLQGKRARITLAVACAFTASTFLLHMFLIAFWCSPISSNWSPPPGEHLCSAVHSMSSVTISTFTNIATDLIILSIPISTLLATQLGKSEKAGLAFVFLMGSVSILAALVRFITLKLVQNVPRAEITHTIDVWALAEIVSSILAVCLPSLRTFARRHRFGGSRENTPHAKHTQLGSRSNSDSLRGSNSITNMECGNKTLNVSLPMAKRDGVKIEGIWCRSEEGERVGLGITKRERDIEALVYANSPEDVRVGLIY
ncbi:uncharacterized protein BDR25DRAFT_386908 [Lindgomyces ingoldianus]|uniref:Uncharacterized protein n=1 Tax=Lindgomyces ingoldianus TaxID=673940 RepID=A0ACB6R6Q6_9PLEO|nr:uncharacterized protein BDR25DRAFT_386908 [Lindgomyces ingoldianus]KAF2473992.1 hypothetical protein BDR25DRAFT_386908 [Lindgomyces ingoldianus]